MSVVFLVEGAGGGGLCSLCQCVCDLSRGNSRDILEEGSLRPVDFGSRCVVCVVDDVTCHVQTAVPLQTHPSE